MKQHRLLRLLGYDPVLVCELTLRQARSLRSGAALWLVACMTLGLAAGYGAWLIHPTLWASILVGIATMLLTLNLLRVGTAGGGSSLGRTPRQSERRCQRYRPSFAPALAFVALAAILAQPFQLVLWPHIGDDVESHREELVRKRTATVAATNGEADYYRLELADTTFFVFRLQQIWQQPKYPLRFTAVFCLFVLLPGLWSQTASLTAIRAYETARCRAKHQAFENLRKRTTKQVATLLEPWHTKSSIGKESIAS